MIYKENNKDKWTKDGRAWYFRCYYTDMYGNRKQKESKKYLTKKEAQEEERKFLSNISTCDTVDSDISFQQVYDEWFEQKKSKVKVTTYYSLKKRLDKYILNYFKPYKINKIKINIINEWQNKILNIDVSMDYRNRIFSSLKEILNYAYGNYEFDLKVISKIKTYKIDTIKTDSSEKENYWTNDEFNIFLKYVDDDFWKSMYIFLYMTGLRFSECIALTWNDIDFNKKTVRINKQLTTKVMGNKYKIISPKTKNSIRIIELDNQTTDILKKHYDSEKKICEFNNDMFVFGNNKYVSQTTFRRKFNNYIEKANSEETLKKITIHGFRHSHASLLINLGLDSRDVVERLGDTVQVVEKVYYHMFPEKKKIPCKH